MRIVLRLLLILVAGHTCLTTLPAQTIIHMGPAGSGKFGARVLALSNGNYVVTDHEFDNGTVTDAGAVYLYNGRTHKLISKLTGSSPFDHVGTYVWPLSNGNFVVGSPDWHNGSAHVVGAATWVNGVTGLNGLVSSGNSLVGSSPNDGVGNTAVVSPAGNILLLNPQWDNGNVTDAGAVTWMNGLTGLSGGISANNSLVGTTKNDRVGNKARFLSNGNYVVSTDRWTNGNIQAAGAVTWCDGKIGLTGAVSSSNSLVGSSTNDQVGSKGIVELANGNYVVISDIWNNGSITLAGAVTWCNGIGGLTGTVSSANSMVGASTSDQIGSYNVLTLTNGNYVILSPNWSNGAAHFAGAATWCDGANGGTGTVSASNSFIGSSAFEMLGYGSVALTNGNYVVLSENWKNGSASVAGAATWCDGSTGRIGNVNASNSLVGSTTNDGKFMRCVALPNGNYIVKSHSWTNGSDSLAGAVTWCNGGTGRTGIIDTGNSLVGTKAGDLVGFDCAVLSNGNYVILSPSWSYGVNIEAGAATWCDGSAGRTGPVNLSNSLVGSSALDVVGEGILVLANGNYVMLTPRWKNGADTNAGAITWCSGTATTSGIIDTTNSVVGSVKHGRLGSSGIALPNGNYVIESRSAKDVAQSWAGAVTWFDGSKATLGTLSSTNSLVGRSYADQVGRAFSAPNDNYIVGSNSNGGAMTFGSGRTGVVGFPDSCNTLFGIPTYQIFSYDSIFDYMVIGLGYDNKVCIVPASLESIARSSGTGDRTFTDTVSHPILDTNGNVICTIRPTTPVATSGVITAKVFLQTSTPQFNGAHYVRRHYDLSTSSIPDTGNATVTLYFRQSEFNAYNSSNGGGEDLPSGPTDLADVANIKVTLHRGSSSTGLPGSYSNWSGSGPANVSIDPADTNIIWNDCQSRWEVTFDMSGYGGLFLLASSQNNPLSAQPALSGESGLLSIAPNPATYTICILCSDHKLIGESAAILDVYGRIIEDFRMKREQHIEVGSWPAGTYYLRTGSGDAYKFLKL